MIWAELMSVPSNRIRVVPNVPAAVWAAERPDTTAAGTPMPWRKWWSTNFTGKNHSTWNKNTLRKRNDGMGSLVKNSLMNLICNMFFGLKSGTNQSGHPSHEENSPRNWEGGISTKQEMVYAMLSTHGRPQVKTSFVERSVWKSTQLDKFQTLFLVQTWESRASCDQSSVWRIGLGSKLPHVWCA